MNISLLGSTGSIGVNTLDVVSRYAKEYNVLGLAACRNIELLEKQARIFKPKVIAVWDHERSLELKKRIKALRIKVISGEEGLCAVACLPKVSRVVFALSGTHGLRPLYEAIRCRKDIAIANKEPLVSAGELIMRAVKKYGVLLIPIDSEHSAIFQCLSGTKREYLKRIVVTASGGPFVDFSLKQLASVTPRQALKHPRWKMGKKITVDSATMMNKGLEIIEASRLFDIEANDIEVVIHRESIVHSLVELIDGSHLAQLATTDMRLPISYALSYPKRLNGAFPQLDLLKIKNLSFERPNKKKFPCLRLAYRSAKRGGTLSAVMNAANEVAVQRFLSGAVSFKTIPLIIERVMNRHHVQRVNSIETVLAVDAWARKEAEKEC